MSYCRAVTVYLFITLAAVLAGCSGASNDLTKERPAIDLQTCRLEGVSAQARCGKLTVFEDRAAESGMQIDIHVALVPAISADPLPDPIVFFAGGPGQSAIKLSGVAYRILERARRDRELLLIDIRGTGQSHALECGQPVHHTEIAAQLAALDPISAAQDCLNKFGTGIRHYTTPNAAADVRDVLDALGYRKVNLWGVSYGTRLGLEFVRQNPDRVRSMVLDGIAPTDIKLPLYFSRDGDLALNNLITHCEADTACNQAMSGLRKDVEHVVDGLRRQPAKVVAIDPSNGQKSEVTIDANAFHSGLRTALYSGELSSLVPLIVHEAKAGNFAPFLAESSWSFGDLEQSMALGLMLNVMCNEEVPRVTQEELKKETTSRVFRADLFDAVVKACAVWPKTTLPSSYYDPVKSAVPALLLSGALDPATPPVWGDLVAGRLPNARHLIAPNIAHNVSPRGCAPKLIAEFIRQADAKGLDGGCLNAISRPAFFVNYAGPPS